MSEKRPLIYVAGHTTLATDLLAAALRPHYALFPDADARHSRVETGIAYGSDMDGAVELVLCIRRSFPEAPVIVTGGSFTEEQCLRLIEMGARAFVPPNESLSALLDTVEAVLRGQALCSPRMASLVHRRLATLARPLSADAPAALTFREAEIFALVREGLSNKEIANRLSISVSTVKNHVHRILEKRHIRRRSEVIDWDSRLKSAARPVKYAI